MQSINNSTMVPALYPDCSKSEGNKKDAKNLFLTLKKAMEMTVPPCSPVFTKTICIEEKKEDDTCIHTHVPNRKEYRKWGNTGTLGNNPEIPTGLTYGLHEFFYGWMEDFWPDWKPRWDRALADKNWQHVRRWMTAIFNRLPVADQRIIEPSVNGWEPWWPEQKHYWPTCYILDRDRHRVQKEIGVYARVAVEVYAESREEAAAKLLAIGYEVKTW